MRIILIIIFLITGFLNGFCQSSQDWKASGITTIKGTINNFQKYYAEYKSIEISFDDWTIAWPRKYYTKIDKNGKFSFSFFVFQTQNVSINYKNKWTTVVVNANDKLELIVNADSFPKGIKYFGKTAKSCENYSEYQKSYSEIFITNGTLYFNFNRTLSFDKYKEWRDSVYRTEQKKVDEYLQQDSLDPYFINWLGSECKLRYQADILKYNPILYSISKPLNEDTIINTLFKIVKSVDLDTSAYLTINSASYFGLVNSLHVRIGSLAYFKYIKERKKALPVAQSKEPQKNHTTDNQLTEEESSKLMFPYFIKTANLLISNTQIKESVIAHKYTMTLERRNIDLGLDSTLAHISNPAIRASLINVYTSYKQRTFDQNSIKADNEGDTLINYLKNKYKGYVQFICIWSTWMGNPFKYISEINKRFAGKKVAFIYLCCNSDKTKWEQQVKEYKPGGEHIFLNSEQYMFLAKIFNIMVLPRYIIINKTGRIVNDNAPQPTPVLMLQDLLVKELTKYLNN